MRIKFIAFAFVVMAFCLSACAASDTPAERANQPHLSPPPFPVSETPPVTQAPEASQAAAKGGLCGPRQDGTGTITCQQGEFCRYELADQCGAADAPGVCTPITLYCPMNLDPVCGCNGRNYANACLANTSGTSAAYKGKCSS